MTQFSILDAELSLTGVREVVTVDISMFADTDEILVTLPDYPGTKVNTALTYIEFTSHPIGDIVEGPTDRVYFNQFVPSLPTTDGNAEGRFPISLLDTIDRSSISAVSIGAVLTSNGTIKFSGIRAVDADWVYAPIDFDSLWNRWERPPSPNGDPAYASGFPTYGSPPYTSDFPIILRSDEISGERDPRVVDTYISSHFITGSLNQASGVDEDHYSTLAWYFREIPVDDQTQLELDTLVQGDLNTLGHQPDFGTAKYTIRRQEDLENYTQTELDANTQFDLETQPDYTLNSWIEVKLRWAKDKNTQLSIKNAEAIGYEFSFDPLLKTEVNDRDAGNYVALIELVGTKMQFKLYECNQVGEIDKSSLLYATEWINDEDIFKRRKGRVGWYAQLLDGDAAMLNVRQRDTNFGEVVTKAFESNTPVMGAQLFTGSSSSLLLSTEVQASPWGVHSIAPDPSASSSGKAYKIMASAGRSLQGVSTNPFVLDNFRYLDARFKIKFPSSALVKPGSGLDVFLYGEYGRCIPLNITPIEGDKWQSIKATLSDDLIQTGTYKLVMVQTLPSDDTTWWLEDLAITTPTVHWSGRSKKPDPWGKEGDQWMAYETSMNKEYGGLVFEERGHAIQTRGRALRQNAVISDFKTIPKYAELGRFIWSDDVPDRGAPPSAAIQSTDQSGLRVNFRGHGSKDIDGWVVAYLWSFGDENYDYGASVSHVYERPGDYHVTLTVVDNLGNQSSASTTVTVS